MCTSTTAALRKEIALLAYSYCRAFIDHGAREAFSKERSRLSAAVVKCAGFRAKSVHISGHLPIVVAGDVTAR
jgi:hypothetical protein